MALIVPNDGKKADLNAFLRASTPGVLIIKLSKNDPSVDRTAVPGTFTEADFGGYIANKDLAGTFAAPTINADNAAQCTATTVSWTGNGGATNTVYWYYVVDSAGSPTKVYWAERLPGAPVNMGATGTQLDITPVFTCKSEFTN